MREEMIHHAILRVVAKTLLPFILLFALYVQFHGDYGPGGGFQAGVIFAAGIILYSLMFSLSRATEVFRPRALEVLVAAGVILFGAVGLLCMVLGGEFLDYNRLARDPHHGQHRGIFLVELGVGITVAAAMATIFYAFVNRERKE